MRQPGDRITIDGIDYIAVKHDTCRGCAFNHGQEFTPRRREVCMSLYEKDAIGRHNGSCGRPGGSYLEETPQVIWLTEVDAALHRLTN